MVPNVRDEAAHSRWYSSPSSSIQFFSWYSRYIETGVEVLDRELLPELLKLKYEAIPDAVAILGSADVIQQTFKDFQKHLYLALTA